MAFTNLTLKTTDLLDTTFIGDMKLIVNANTKLLKTQIEDLFNTLQIDLVNKYIGVDTPINKLYAADEVITNSIIFKAGATVGASTIASLTQSGGISSFTADNMTFTKVAKSVTTGATFMSPTVVIGMDGSNVPIVNPTTGGVADQGLYVGDATTPIKSRFYGPVEIPKSAVTQSYSSSGGNLSPRKVDLIANGTSYAYAKLNLTNSDPQFIYVDLTFQVGYTNYGNPIWLLLHESAANRPNPGQTFTIILNKVYKSDFTEIDYTLLPAISSVPANAGINIICGDDSDGNYKRAMIESATWTTVPVTDTDAIAAVGTDPLAYYFRLGNPSMVSSTTIRPRAYSVSFTKTEQSTNFSNYTITSSQNIMVIN